MIFIISIVHFLLAYVRANITNDFILDYFNYKKATSVVGYSCNNMPDNIRLIKLFNKNGVTAILNGLADKTRVHYAAKTTYYKVGVFLDTRCYDVHDIASLYLDAANQRIYGELHYWLVLGKNLTDVLADVNDNAFGLSTDFVVAVSGSLENFKMYDVYNKYKAWNFGLNVTFYGDWNSRSRLNVELLQIKPTRRSNLQGIPLRVMFYQALYKPKNSSLVDYFNEYRDIARDARLKFGWFILSHLSNLLNFSIEYVEASKWAHGDGLGPTVRALMNSSIDLSGTPGNINTERLPLVKFIHQGWPFRTCFIFRNPQPKAIKIEAMLRPFIYRVWYLMGGISLICIVVLFLTLKWDCQGNCLIKVSNSLIMTFGAICQQETEIEMIRTSTRIAFFTILLFSLMMYNYYSASVVSTRLDEPIFKINDSLSELGKLHIRMASERMFYLSFFFASSDKETQKFHEDYWFKIPESQQFLDPEVGIELVRHGVLAYHVHPDVAYTLIEKHYNNREICELMEVHWGRLVDTMFSTTRNSTFQQILRIGFLKITEVGLRYRQIKRWQYRKPVCHKNVLNVFSINIHEFATHLILLVIGILAAFFVHGLELMVFKLTVIVPIDYYDERKGSIRTYIGIL